MCFSTFQVAVAGFPKKVCKYRIIYLSLEKMLNICGAAAKPSVNLIYV